MDNTSMQYEGFNELNLPQIESTILKKWEHEETFVQTINNRANCPSFVFYEGPPSANGMPGIHHVISRAIKDIVCRYKTMQGYEVLRKGGWDTHGLPIELSVEKELKISKEDIGKKISIADYNKQCRAVVLRFKNEWDEITKKMGYWVDLDNPYITFENNYIESLWWLLKKLYDKKLLYQSLSIQPYSPAAGTGLSSHELNQPGTYKTVKDTACTAMFLAKKTDRSEFLFSVLKKNHEDLEIFFLAWTTTPWTLPANLGLTVNGHIQYWLIKTINPYTNKEIAVVMAGTLFAKYFSVGNDRHELLVGDKSWSSGLANDVLDKSGKITHYHILASFLGKDLEGCSYEQLLPYPANHPNKLEKGTKPFTILVDDFVTTEDGTGIVHTAPAFGADDYKVGKKYNIGILILVDRTGKFVDDLGPWSGRYVKNYKDEGNFVDVNVDIAVHLKKENRAFKVEKYEHNYPHCWRTDKPILYYPLTAWFIRTTAFKDKMVALNKKIVWKPASTGEGRFGNWLENIVDWNLSRSRFWGTPLPIWRTADGEEEICIGSIEALKNELHRARDLNDQETLDATIDLHKPYVDNIVLLSPRGKKMTRVPDLVDVWFDSGAMPFAQWHFPFENKKIFSKNYPADFICEGVDQTRGWFYTLHVISALLEDDIAQELQSADINSDAVQGIAYKKVVSNGLVLDKNGNKMSKRLGNVINPFETINRYGADATRWYLITNAVPWDNLKFDLSGIEEVQRKFFGTLYNVYNFFILYANVDSFSFKETDYALNKRPEMDRWILSALHSLIQSVTEDMDNYDLTQAGRRIEQFLDEQLSNWYVRLCRRRFWKGQYEADKISAYQTLYECLETVLVLSAPIAPFFTECLFLRLNQVTKKHAKTSIHLLDYPKTKQNYINKELEERMQLAQDISSLVLSIRKKIGIKVRQPLQRIKIPIVNSHVKHQIEQVDTIIKAEVNIKEIDFVVDSQSFQKKVKPKFAVLGKKHGNYMKEIVQILQEYTQAGISALETTGSAILKLQNGDAINITIGDVDITADNIAGWQVATNNNLTVALDTTLSDALIKEGLARELINKIQGIRKDMGLDVTDKIKVSVQKNQKVPAFLSEFNSYICTEILAQELKEIDTMPANNTVIDINGNQFFVCVSKIG